MVGTLTRLATRGSPLALWQAERVAAKLTGATPGLSVELVVVDTAGDRNLDRSIGEIGGQGVFVKEIQAAVLDGRADMAVHSAKDLPSATPPGLVLAAVPERGDPRDVLVGSTLKGLAPGANVATGSVRRRAQLAWLRPDLTFADLRGNIATRLGKLPAGGALVMAAVALDRLGLRPAVVEKLDLADMVPQVGQAAIAVECRAADGYTNELLACINDVDEYLCVIAERAFLATFGGGCDLPVGAHATLDGQVITMEGIVGSPDGKVILRERRSGERAEPVALGDALGRFLLDAGGSDLLVAGGSDPAGRPGLDPGGQAP